MVFSFVKVVALVSVSVGIAIGFQNCSQVKFTKVGVGSANLSSISSAPVTPICSPSSRPTETENYACPSPNQSSIDAIQRFTIICQASGKWARTTLGSLDYSLCKNTCPTSARPSDRENVNCPAPNSTLNNGVQNYSVHCSVSGTWSRSILGDSDYSLCPRLCDLSKKPSTMGNVACPTPNNLIMSGIQNYIVKCNSNGIWTQDPTGSIDYGQCPGSCNAATKPAASDAAKCPSSSDMLARQNYQVSCLANLSWNRTPTTFDTSACPAPTCNPGSKPPPSERVSCPAPNQSVKNATQNYSVTCSGTNWVQSGTTLDISACPKTCAGPVPANSADPVACAAPNVSILKAKQNYTYVCNSQTGAYDKTPSGGIDYSMCPMACTGTPPASRIAVACPAGTTGTAYQNYNIACNTTTGQYVPTPSSLDASACIPVVLTCPTQQPNNFDAISCPSPFSDRMDGRNVYNLTCVNGAWARTGSPSANYTNCPVNDCTGQPNPGPTKVVGYCPGGSSGQITQSCGVTCSGRTYVQNNCSANNYAQCDCGASATFNPNTQTCIAKPVTSCTVTPSTTSLRVDQGFSITNTTTNASRIELMCPFVGPTWYQIDMNSTRTWPGNTLPVGSPSCSFRAISSYTGAAVDCYQSPITFNVQPMPALKCAAGSSNQLSAPNSAAAENICMYSWGEMNAGTGSTQIPSSNIAGATMNHSCDSNGVHHVDSFVCPTPANPPPAPPKCTPFDGPAKCVVIYKCRTTGGTVASPTDTGIGVHWNINASPNESVDVQPNQSTFLDSTIMYSSGAIWNGLQFTCVQSGGSANWRQTRDGDCTISKFVEDTDPRCDGSGQPGDTASSSGAQ